MDKVSKTPKEMFEIHRKYGMKDGYDFSNLSSEQMIEYMCEVYGYTRDEYIAKVYRMADKLVECIRQDQEEDDED